jgi:hypothetical protein
MDWRVKAAAATICSYVPGGGQAYIWAQQHVTRTLPPHSASLDGSVAIACRHLAALEKHGTVPLAQARLYEWGAGWNLAIPLTYWCCGVNDQCVVDIRPLARPALIQHAAKSIRERHATFARVPEMRGISGSGLSSLTSEFGIKYIAPVDARRTGFPAASIDYVTSTSTWEHMKPEDLRATLIECRRLMRPDAIATAHVDYTDHYAHSDSRRSVYDFLRHEEWSWALLNPPFHYQNRLRHADYLALIREAGFEIVEVDSDGGDERDCATVSGLQLSSRFRSYAANELAIRHGFFVMRRPA